MLIYRNAEGVHGQRKFDNICLNLNLVPSPRVIFGGLSPPNKAPSPPNWNREQYKSVEFLSIFRMSSHPAQMQSHLQKRKAPLYWTLSGDGSAWTSATDYKGKCFLL